MAVVATLSKGYDLQYVWAQVHCGPVKGLDTASDLREFCGAEGIRTPDPLHAMEVRYQLRYSPASRIPARIDRNSIPAALTSSHPPA